MAKVMLKNVRISFVKVFEAESFGGGEPKFSTQIILDKESDNVEKLEKAILEAAKEKFASKIKGDKISASLKTPLRDGDIEREDYPEIYAGKLFANATSKRRPLVINADKTPLTADDDVIYSGCYANVSVDTYPFDVSSNKGVALGLNGLQFAGHGEPLAGNGVSIEDFEEVEVEEDEAEFF